MFHKSLNWIIFLLANWK